MGLARNSLSGTLPSSLTGLSQLEHLQFGNSGLCAPADAGFQTWLKGLSDAQSSSVTLDQNCTDRQILTALYEDTGGANWNHTANWLDDQANGNWYGVHTNTDGRVRRIDLSLNNLSGKLPAYVASLTELEGLWIQENGGLSGPLPQSLTGLSKLTSLRFNSTGLCAPLDTDFQTWLGGVGDKQGSNCAE